MTEYPSGASVSVITYSPAPRPLTVTTPFSLTVTSVTFCFPSGITVSSVYNVYSPALNSTNSRVVSPFLMENLAPVNGFGVVLLSSVLLIVIEPEVPTTSDGVLS